MVKALPSSPASSCSPVHTRVIGHHENQDRCLVVKCVDLGLEEPELTSWLSHLLLSCFFLSECLYLPGN